MPSYRYSAYNAAGGEAKGTIEAENQADAAMRLRKDGLFARELVEDAGVAGGRNWFGRKGPSLSRLALMTRQLATLTASAVPVYESIATLWGQETDPQLKGVLGRVRDRVAGGASLSRAMADEPQVFGENYTSMVAAGEVGGALDQVLERLADFLEDQEAMRSRVTAALAYPVLMAIVGTGVMLFLLAFVIPKIVVIFEQNRAALPLITVILIKLSQGIRYGWWLILILIAGAVAWYRRLMRNEDWRRRRDRLLLRLPQVGPLLRKLLLARFAKVLGLLLASGVPVIRALEITGEAVVNREYRAALREAAEEIVQGGSLSAALAARSALFPPLLTHLAAVGEKGGELEAMLLKAGGTYEREFSADTTRLMALLEPLMVLAMGVVVGTVVIAVLLPIFQLNQLVK